MKASSVLLALALSPAILAQGSAPVPGETPSLPGAANSGVISGGQSVSPAATTGIVPIVARNSFGNTNNNIPFSWTPCRYQQVFLGSELPTALPILYTSLRQDNGFSGYTGYIVELQMTFGYTSKTQTSLTTTFASNFDVTTPGPVVVIAKKKISFPKMPSTKPTNPHIFFLQFKLDKPFVWAKLKNRNFLVEVANYGNSNSNKFFTYPLDAASGSTTSRLYNTSSPTATTGFVGRGYGLVFNFENTPHKPGAYTLYGSGCPGTGIPVPPQLNPNASGFSSTTFASGRQFVYEAVAKYDMLVTGFELYCAGRTSSSSTSTYIYLPDSTGNKPLTTAAATSTMTYTTTGKWNATAFKAPYVKVKKGQKFWIGLLMPSSFNIALNGGDKGSYFWNHPTWSGPWSSYAFGYKVKAIGGSNAAPNLSASVAPEIGQNFQVNLDSAAGGTAAILVTGVKRLSIDLSAAGAKGCSLYASLDFLFGFPTSKSGTASAILPLPNDRSLIGGTFSNQWVVIDPKAPNNTLGLVFSNGGAAQIGG